MKNIDIWKYNFFHLIIISLAIYGWVFTIPVMYPYLNLELPNNPYFFEMILLSTFVALLFNKYFGDLNDKLSSRTTLLIGLILNMLAWILLFIGGNIYIISVAFIFEGLSFAAVAISRGTYCHDLVCSIKTEEDYINVEAKIRKIVTFLMIIVLISTPYLYEINPKIPFLCNALLGFIAIISLYKNRNIDIAKNKTKEVVVETSTKIMDNIKNIHIKSKALIWLILTEGLFIATSSYVLFTYQIHLLDNLSNVIFIGYFVVAGYISKMFGAYLMEKKVSTPLAGFFILMLSILTIVSALISNHYILLIIFIFHSMFREYSAIYLETYIIKNSPYEMRGRAKGLSEIFGNVFLIISMALSISIQKEFLGAGLLIFFGSLFFILYFFLYLA